MARQEFSGSVIVQKTIGTAVKTIDDLNITTASQTVAFGVNLINYFLNKGAVSLTVEFWKDGSMIGKKVLAGGYGFNDTYIQIDSIKVYTLSGSTTLDGMGVA